MKIKVVCEITGLTDRTVRYYIEQGLISPEYSENYLGRKTFDFSPENIDELKDIATLRKFDFSIGEIRDIMLEPQNSRPVIQSVKERTEKAVDEGQAILSALSSLDEEKVYTVPELAKALSDTHADIPEKEEKVTRGFWKTLLSIIKAIVSFIIVWFPIALCVRGYIWLINHYQYPAFNAVGILLTVASILPSIFYIIAYKFKWKKIVKGILIAFCILSVPFSAIMPLGAITHSETTNIHNYYCFDARCPIHRFGLFEDLFPPYSHYAEDVKGPDGNYETVYLDTEYYYSFKDYVDYTFDVYAEWPLKKVELYSEVDRVKKLFSELAEIENSGWEYIEMDKGKYHCLILYERYCDKPFEQVDDSYTYYIFAYDEKIGEKQGTVRYICCVSLENGADQPYYLTLDW